MKLWINENEAIELGDRQSLTREIAPRSRSLDWMGIMGFLPDPDPILRATGNDITVYRQLLSDAHVFSCNQSRKSGTLSCEWEIRESIKGLTRTNKRAYQMIQEMMEKLDVYQSITDMLDAPFFGMSPLEVIWENSANAWVPEKVVGKPPEWFVFDAENKLRFRSKDHMLEGEELPDYKFLLPRHHATYQNPYGERTLSRCFWPVAFKKGGFKFWAIFTEKYGMPWVVGKVPRSTNETERAQLLTQLASMVQDAVAVINDDESIVIEESKGKSASAEIYEKLISAANREISKAILGQTLTTELDKGGSYAATKEHMEVRGDIVDQDKRMVAEAFDQLFSWIVALNFADAQPPKFAFFEEEDVQKDRADRDKILSEQGVKFKKSYYQRTYNLEESDFDLVDPEARNRLPGEQQGPTGEFAEGDEGVSTSTDIISEKALSEASLDDLIIPVETLLEKSKTLEDFQRNLLEIYQNMDESNLGDLMQKAFTLADLSGRFDADA